MAVHGPDGLITVSRHAVKRIRERLGLPKKAAEAEAQRAFRNGIRAEETSGRLRAYFEWLEINHDGRAEYVVTPSGVHVIKEDTLVTVLPVPKEHANRIMNVWKKRRLN